MRILPVLDLLNGRAVRAIAGNRAAYQPLVPTSDPLAVARTYRELLQGADLYLADLDAIQGSAPAWDLYARLHAEGFSLWLDAGIQNPADAEPLAAAGIARIIVGLETMAGPAALAAIAAAWPERTVFSLDLRAGRPITATSWQGNTPRAIANEAIALGVRRLLILDLARIGGGQGTGTESLLAALHQAYPEVELLAGGGVRDEADLRRLEQAGASWALVASALHDGTLTSSAPRRSADTPSRASPE
jgi:phosphoribosylformimino-5-aminoimidazole carboxamide ribotide isomerase